MMSVDDKCVFEQVNHCCLPDIAEEILITLSLVIVQRSHDQMLSGMFFSFQRCQVCLSHANE